MAEAKQEEDKRAEAIKALTERYSKEELAELYLDAQSILDRTPENVRRAMDLYGQMVGLKKRNYEREVGILAKVKWEPVQYWIYEVDREMRQLDREWVKEERLSKLDASIVLRVDEIQNREEVEEG